MTTNTKSKEFWIFRCKLIVLIPDMHMCLRTIYFRWRLTVATLTYNHFTDASYISDVLLTPLFVLVEKFTKTLGTILVIAVCALTSSVVILAYWLGIPHWWAKSPLTCICLLLLGHWILLNIVYNYFKACTVPPGYPPEGELISEAVSICKKCVKPKPPRAHHCSVCNRCILKMDHHCPWLNNCVGHNNHRFFYLYMVWMVIGVVYLIGCGWEVAYDVTYHQGEPEGHTIRIDDTGAMISQPDSDVSHLKRKCVIYVTLLTVGVLVALGCLTIWHGKMISRNETSIEVEINKAERSRLRDFLNPYDLGRGENWRRFLGVVSVREGWRQVLWPSPYNPDGDGLMWPTRHKLT